MKTLYTIGHSKHSIEHFLFLLEKNQINCVVDVRSVPYSKFSPQFNTNEIKKILTKYKIYYIFMGEEFGARRSEPSLLTENGFVDFEKVKKNSVFMSGIQRIEDGIKKGFKIAFMCTEKDPIDCHRNILVAKTFYDRGYNIQNIHFNGKLETQEEVNERLLNLYFPNRNQKTILDFLEGEKPIKQMLSEAYRIRNSEIAYRLEKIGDKGVIL